MPNHFIYSDTPKEAEAFVAARVSHESAKPVLFVAPNDREMDLAVQQLQAFAKSAVILPLPAWDCLPYDRSSPKHSLMAQRLSTLSHILNTPPGKRLIIVTTINALTQKLPPRSSIEHATLLLTQGSDLNRDALMRYLVANGYTRVSKVMEPGEFALRGNIIDLFPSGYEHGCRIDLFGDEIESIQGFDPLSQRSDKKEIGEITLHPVSEVLLDEKSIERFRDNYRESFGAISKPDQLYNSISQGHTHPGMEHWLPLFYGHLDTLYTYLPDDVITIFAHQTEIARTDRCEVIDDYFQARSQMIIRDAAIYHPLPPARLYVMEDEWQVLTHNIQHITLSPFSDAKGASQAIKQGREFSGERRDGKNPFEFARTYIQQQINDGKQIFIASISDGSQENLKEKLTLAAKTKIVTVPLARGFVSNRVAVISEQDILGERRVQKRTKRRTSEQFFAEAANFTEGELVVHKENGIGRFEGLVTVEAGGISHDCLKLVYAENSRLFLPVENIDIITRYGDVGDGDGENLLDKLGASNWQNRKARLKERIKMAAEELLKIAAKRNIAKAPILSPAEGLYDEFCRRFPFVETEDQQSSIDNVLEDFSTGRPADRLICGDVGFGKTEVALRAAFVAATAAEGGVQVALIAPTTLLVRQHVKTFQERFKGLPIEIRQLSRLVSAKETKQTIELIEQGKIDIVIGTHALLAERIKFKDLGLLIVDEEQHFGVKQKEKLKALRSNIHVITLSATPIPRTLQMALTGVRDLSLITTPPVDRLAIRTFVSPYDPVMIREALLREFHRGGQSFYVTPYIKDIAELKNRITDLVPEIKVIVAHGQMPASELDTLMNDFYEGKYDVLMSTSIIESGIDIPTANTLIVNRADRFGLSQLYQLRGRVGRSKTRAYAYLTLPHNKHFTANAMRRLEVMQTLDTLGAGFTVASHDMEIRGFGNLVGEEQSGQIREVGVELYQHMLEEAVQKARKDKTAEESAAIQDWSPQIKLGLSVLIPEEYVSDLDLRLGLYRRAGTLSSNEQIDDFALELTDRFGKSPETVEHFLETLRLKLLCREAKIERIDAGPKGIVLTFYQNKVNNPQALMEFINQHKQQIKIRADQKLVMTYDARHRQQSQRLAFLHQILEKLAKLNSPRSDKAA
ncbi:MAG: transcription-repair coupling factor [Rickettsiales bacterium]|nr:transcription-repair coupling factor [Rickettsiales bacterium]